VRESDIVTLLCGSKKEDYIKKKVNGVYKVSITTEVYKQFYNLEKNQNLAKKNKIYRILKTAYVFDNKHVTSISCV
jgi:hypothetical protein